MCSELSCFLCANIPLITVFIRRNYLKTHSAFLNRGHVTLVHVILGFKQFRVLNEIVYSLY
jgi:hypothetical protein